MHKNDISYKEQCFAVRLRRLDLCLRFLSIQTSSICTIRDNHIGHIKFWLFTKLIDWASTDTAPPLLWRTPAPPFYLIQRTVPSIFKEQLPPYSKNCSASKIKGRNSIAKQGYLLTDISIIVPEGFKLMPFTIQKNLATQENPIEYQTGNKREIFTRNLRITALDLPQHQSQQTRTTSIIEQQESLLGGLWWFSSHNNNNNNVPGR